MASRKGLQFIIYFNVLCLLTKHSRALIAKSLRFHLLTDFARIGAVYDAVPAPKSAFLLSQHP
jgi:hypothetical protein